MQRISELLRERRIALLGHLIRSEDKDIMKQLTLSDQIEPVKQKYKRVGRPRLHWTEVIMNDAFLKIEGLDFNPNDATHKIVLVSAAFERNI